MMQKFGVSPALELPHDWESPFAVISAAVTTEVIFHRLPQYHSTATSWRVDNSQNMTPG